MSSLGQPVDPHAAIASLVATSAFLSAEFNEFVLGAEEERGIHEDIAELAHLIVTLQTHGKTKDLERVFAEAERLLSAGSEETRALVVTGLFENLQNITSHTDVEADANDFEFVLGRNSRQAWGQLNSLWDAAMRFVDEQELSRTMTEEKYHAIVDGSLRRFVQAHTRRAPSGVYYSMSDVLRYEYHIQEGGNR